VLIRVDSWFYVESNMNSDVDVLIIGAGPAGSMAAALLHQQGLRVLVVESQRFPRFVIGESLLPHCMDFLKEAGLLAAVEKQGFMLKRGAVFLDGDKTCDFDFGDQFTAGWTYTFQVTRAEFDKALADEVASRGVEICYEHKVTSANFESSHATVEIEGPGSSQGSGIRVQDIAPLTPAQTNAEREQRGRVKVKAGFVLDCSGYGRVLPRLLNLEAPSEFPQRDALFTHVTGDLRPTCRDEGKIWICVHPGGAWLWVIPFSNGKTSVGAVADPAFFAQYPGDREEQLRAILMSDPNAGKRLADAQFVFSPQRISGYACSVKTLHGPRFALVGNATEFLDPIFSSGVTLALASARLAAKALVRQHEGEAVDWQRDYVDPVMQGINTFRAYVSSWYNGTLRGIIFSAAANRDIMKQICSVLAGYVWDTSNPYVKQPDRALPLLARVVEGLGGAR
jgi:flavin-dependent dehydrogenase